MNANLIVLGAFVSMFALIATGTAGGDTA